MKVDCLVVGISELATAEGAGPRHGHAMGQLKLLRRAALAVASGRIAWIGMEADWNGDAETVVDVGGCAVVPGLG